MQIEDHEIRLQSMRGLAALSVAIGHCFISLPHGRIEQANFVLAPGNALLALGELLFQPNTAVVFFYVLSGLVLRESLRRRQQAPAFGLIAGFAVRRLCRMLPAMWLSIAVAIAVVAFLPGAIKGASAFHNDMMVRTLSLGAILGDLVAWSYYLNPVLWSIQVELVMILPLVAMFWLSTRLSAAVSMAIFTILAAGSILLWIPSPNPLRYVYCFYAGVALPELLSDRRTARALSDGRIALGGLAFLLPTEFLYVSGRLWLPYKLVIDTVVSAQIIGFVLLRPEATLVQKLSARPLAWLGDISYSFYVFSFQAQIAIASVLLSWFLPVGNAGATVLTLAITGLTIAVTAGVAAASHRFVEIPGIGIGRRWSSRIESRPFTLLRRSRAPAIPAPSSGAKGIL